MSLLFAQAACPGHDGEETPGLLALKGLTSPPLAAGGVIPGPRSAVCIVHARPHGEPPGGDTGPLRMELSVTDTATKPPTAPPSGSASEAVS